jgi:hypothetical protein
MAAYHVVDGGRTKAKSKPVSAALKSFIADGFFLMVKTQFKIRNIALYSKNIIEAAIAGIKAIIT